jgi:hypothetical protein
MATVVEEPRQRALDLPTVLHDLEPLARVLDDLQVNFVHVLQAADPVTQPLRLIPRIDPDLPEPRHTRSTILSLLSQSNRFRLHGRDWIIDCALD